jgi:hypothetical protein
MLLHLRKVIIVGPDEARVVAFSPSSEWKQEIGRLVNSIGRKATRHGMVMLAEPSALEREIEGRDDLFRCPACDELRQCSVYEGACEQIAERMSLLSVCIRNDGQWAWLAPESVIHLSRVTEDFEIGARMRRALGVNDEDDSFVGSVKDMFRQEVNAAKGFASAVRSRLKRKVTASAGKAAGRAVDEVIDNVVDIGASAFKQRFRAAATSGSYPSGSVPIRSERETAADLLGVREDASDEEVDRAWRLLTQTYHPDRNPERQEWANAKMREINAARETLKRR